MRRNAGTLVALSAGALPELIFAQDDTDTAALAKEAYASGRTIRDLARERTALSEADLDRILDPAAMVEPGRSFAGGG